MSRGKNSTTVDDILDELDTTRIEKENSIDHSFDQLGYDGNICTMVEERHEERDSWLTVLIEGVVISH